MNLTMDVMRLIVVRALRGRTWVGPAVFDSPASPSSIDTRGKRTAFISVYVDEADADLSDSGSIGSIGEGSTVRLVLEIGVASPYKFNREGQQIGDDEAIPEGGFEATQLDATSEGLEMQMGMIARQALDALTSTNPSNPWAEMFRMLSPGSTQRMDIRRGGPSGDQKNPGPRYASRVLIIHCYPLAEPPRGVDLADYPFWEMFFEACEGDAEIGDVAALIKDHIVRPSGELPDWRIAQKLLNVPRETISVLGIDPLCRTDDQVATLTEVNVKDQGGLDRVD